MQRLLIIDDEKSILDFLSLVFKREGYAVETCLSAVRTYELIDNKHFDLILSDIKLPQGNGLDILSYVKDRKPEIPVIMITAYGTIKQAVEAFKLGAADYVLKPFDVEELKIIVSRSLERRKIKEENILLKKELKKEHDLKNLVGKSRAMTEIYDLIGKVSETDSTVLISGESGTGKEMAARAVHFHSSRRKNPFVSINCGALPENLLESELFGHAKGSFTGAIANKKGMFEVAEKGALFLDEVGELSPWTQVKLLRTLQDKKVRQVGGTEEIAVDVRIIAATNQDLKQMIKEQKFREDLFYRLNVISFEMPPLRERKEDIPRLVSHFLQKYSQKMKKKMKRLAPDVIGVFESYHWPGNVRELENVIERIFAIEDRETITEDSLPDELLHPQSVPDTGLSIQHGFNLNETIDEMSRNFILQALDITGGNLKQSASVLGIPYRSLRYLISKFDLRNSQENKQISMEATQKT